MAGLRVMVFDRTCTRSRVGVGLSHAWHVGGSLYKRLGRLDAFRGAATWPEALDWLAGIGEGHIDEIQYWGHGLFGRLLLDRKVLDAAAFEPTHAWAPLLSRIRERLDPTSLLWLRTCETFGTAKGQAFAVTLRDYFGCRVAGHTHRIGTVQSGLHCLGSEDQPSWSVDEGTRATVDGTARSLGSRLWYANTITCLHGSLPPEVR